MFTLSRRFGASTPRARTIALALVAVTVVAAGSSAEGGESATNASGAASPAETPVINFAAYSTPREAYGKIIPAFVSVEGRPRRQNVIFQESYQGSTTQAASVIAGYEADVVASPMARWCSCCRTGT